MNRMFSFVNDINNYDERMVGRDTSAYTSDEGHETALLDQNGAHPVERYGTRSEAEAGHKKWLEFANTANGQKVIKLGGLGELVGPEEIILNA